MAPMKQTRMMLGPPLSQLIVSVHLASGVLCTWTNKQAVVFVPQESWSRWPGEEGNVQLLLHRRGVRLVVFTELPRSTMGMHH